LLDGMCCLNELLELLCRCSLTQAPLDELQNRQPLLRQLRLLLLLLQSLLLRTQ